MAVLTGLIVIAVVYMGLQVMGISPSKVWKAGLEKLKGFFKKKG